MSKRDKHEMSYEFTRQIRVRRVDTELTMERTLLPKLQPQSSPQRSYDPLSDDYLAFGRAVQSYASFDMTEVGRRAYGGGGEFDMAEAALRALGVVRVERVQDDGLWADYTADYVLEGTPYLTKPTTQTTQLTPGYRGIRMELRKDMSGSEWIDTYTPYHPAYVRLASSGEYGPSVWFPPLKRWEFLVGDDVMTLDLSRKIKQISDLLISVYGTEGNPPKEFCTVWCRIDPDYTGDVWGCGRAIRSRGSFGRATRPADGPPQFSTFGTALLRVTEVPYPGGWKLDGRPLWEAFGFSPSESVEVVGLQTPRDVTTYPSLNSGGRIIKWEG